MSPATGSVSPVTGGPNEDSDRGRQRSRSDVKDEEDTDKAVEASAEEGNNHASSNSDRGPARKRRRSRKGLDKKFECNHEGCGKSYSRAEHL